MTGPAQEADDLADRTFTPITGEAPGQDAGDAQAEQAPQQLTNGQLLTGAISAARDVFCIVTKLESPKQVLDAEATQKLGELWGPVLDKHGIELAKYLGDYALEIAAVIGTLTIGARLRSVVIAEIIAKRPQAAPAPAADDGNTVEG